MLNPMATLLSLSATDKIQFGMIQFPLAYNFPQDAETGVVERTFKQDAFMGDSTAALTERKFSLVNPETNMALEVRDCSISLKMSDHKEELPSQQFKITANDQLESVYCPEKVLSVQVQRTSWMCKRGDDKVGLVTVNGVSKPESSVCNSKKGCSNDCTIDPIPINDYCVDGNKLHLTKSRPNDISQKWRFYDNGIMNLACRREPLFQGLVISQINDDEFQELSLFEDVDISFVNNGMAISVGEAVSLVVNYCFGIQ